MKLHHLLLTLIVSSTVHAASSPMRHHEVEVFLQSFRADPKGMMDAPLVKRDALGREVEVKPVFTDEEIKSGAFVSRKDELRSHMDLLKNGTTVTLPQLRPGRAGYDPYYDNYEDLVDVPEAQLVKRPQDMSRLDHARLDHNPWSDSYWPIYKGQLGARYGDDNFNQGHSDWRRYYDFTHMAGQSFADVFGAVRSGASSPYALDDLSPSEKYDLIVGDAQGTLTHHMWEGGRSYYESSGKVETWMGLCHGWAAAAIMEDRPTDTIEVPAANNVMVRFYPSDIKALATALWANAHAPAKNVGGRCNVKDPRKDENGRIIDKQCFDTNPGTFHLAMVNQLGIAKRAVVMDATYDYEVWNHPIVGYRYSYFNPQTDRSTDDFNQAVIPMSSYSNDIFRKYRSRDAVSIVGVSMDVEYLVETQPSHHQHDSDDQDVTYSVRYVYDLELNRDGEIIGGEWRSNKHPDFLWVNPRGQTATTTGDRLALGEWNAKEQIPSAWSLVIPRSSANGTPLSKIVSALIKAARE